MILSKAFFLTLLLTVGHLSQMSMARPDSKAKRKDKRKRKRQGNNNRQGDRRRQGNGRGRAKALKKLKRLHNRYQLKKNSNVQLNKVDPLGIFQMGDSFISLQEEDLTPINVYKKNAVIKVDGLEQLPLPQVYQSKKDKNVLVSKNSKGKLVSATSHQGKKWINLVSMEEDDEDLFATFDSDDMDVEEMERYTLEDIALDLDRQLRGSTAARELQNIGPCSSYGYDVIEIGIVTDSYLCSAKGGAANVESFVQSVIAGASQFYQVDGLCKKIEISTLDINCNPPRAALRCVVCWRISAHLFGKAMMWKVM